MGNIRPQRKFTPWNNEVIFHRVKVLSPEITDIREDDGFHLPEVSMWHTVMARYVSVSRGLSPWYDIERKLQELGRALMFLAKETHYQMRDKCETQMSRRVGVNISALQAIRTKEILEQGRY